MQPTPILVRMELGSATGTVPAVAPITDELLGKAAAAGVSLKPAAKRREPLEHPQAWGAPPGQDGVVAYLGGVTSREDAVAVLSAITVTAEAVIDVCIPSKERIEEFQRDSQRIVAESKQSAQVTQRVDAGDGRHHAKTISTARPTQDRGEDQEVAQLRLDTPATARTTPLDVLALLA